MTTHPASDTATGGAPAERRDEAHRLVDCVVVVTGAAPIDPTAVRVVPPDATVIAADGGLDHALAAGLHPTVLIGDLDSVSADALGWARRHAEVVRHPPNKDLTDTELALERALALHPGRIVMVAGGGDRVDHTMAAIGALGHPSLTAVPRLECVWGSQHLHVLHGPARQSLDLDVGSTISLLALHGACRGVTLRGTKWTLDDADLAPAVGMGVSNVVTAPPVRVGVGHGVLTIVVTPAPRPDEHRSDEHQPEPPAQPGGST